MLVSDLLHSCANDRVAAAAVSSIGGDFAVRLQSQADEDGSTIGAYAARIVRNFARGASEREWRDLVLSVRGQDHPVLSGLQVILERRTQGLPTLTRGSRSLPIRMSASAFAA